MSFSLLQTKHGSETKINALFEKYMERQSSSCNNESPDLTSTTDASTNNNCQLSKEGSDHHLILAAGTESLCRDLDLKPDDFRVLVLAWKCGADMMCRFTRAQFASGCRALKADSVRGLQTRLVEAVADVMANADHFKSLYKFTFR